MTNLGEHFVYLSIALSDLHGTEVLTRPVAVLGDGQQVLVGIDADRRKHLLVPIADQELDRDTASQGVALAERVLEVEGVTRRFLDLVCRIPSLDLVFEHLASDVVSRLTDEWDDPVVVCQTVLAEWRALLKRARSGLDRERLVGLIGELEVLGRLAVKSPVAALEAWTGPTGSKHDFTRGRHAIEVKSTTSIGGDTVSISNLDQLDPDLVGTLHLVVVHLNPDPEAPRLHNRVRELIRRGVPHSPLIDRLASVGYIYEQELDLDDRYSIRSVRGWLVDESFPGLRRSTIGEERLRGVKQIRYELDLDAVPLRLADDELGILLGDWMRIPGG